MIESNISTLNTPYYRRLSDSQVQQIHHASLEIMERTGIRLPYQAPIHIECGYRDSARIEERGKHQLSIARHRTVGVAALGMCFPTTRKPTFVYGGLPLRCARVPIISQHELLLLILQRRGQKDRVPNHHRRRVPAARHVRRPDDV